MNKMTFDQYIQNPMGIANSVISNREMYRTMYRQKWDVINLREHGEVKYKLYKTDKSVYYAYLKIPSEAIKNFYYDVVIKFTPPDDKGKAIGNSLKEYNVQFFSNDPAFVYTFAHAFIKNGLFIKELSHKMSKQAITKAATEKNPSNQVGYVKSLYFAYIIMTRRGLFNKLQYVNKLNVQELNENIMHADQKIAERQEAAIQKSRNNRKKIDIDKDELKSKHYNIGTQIKHTATGVTATKMVNKVKNTVNKNNTIKTVKTTKRK